MAKTKSAAVLTINGPGKMSIKGRKQIAEWLRRAAKDLEELGSEYTEGRFTGRYLVALFAFMAAVLITGCSTNRREAYYLPQNFPHLSSPRAGLDDKHWMTGDPDMARPLNASWPVPSIP